MEVLFVVDTIEKSEIEGIKKSVHSTFKIDYGIVEEDESAAKELGKAINYVVKTFAESEDVISFSLSAKYSLRLAQTEIKEFYSKEALNNDAQ